MRDLLKSGGLIRVCRWLIGFVFLYAALAKIGDISTFASQIHHFRLAPVWSENLIAMVLPWVELAAGLSLLLGIRPRAGGMTAAILMAVFLVAVGLAVLRGLDIECGCFGTSDGAKVGLAKLAENTGLLVLSWIGSREIPRAS